MHPSHTNDPLYNTSIHTCLALAKTNMENGESITVPVMLSYGVEDRVTPKENVVPFFELIKGNNEKNKIVEYASNHSLILDGWQIDKVFAEAFAWLEDVLK